MLTRMDAVEQLMDDARKDAGWKWSEVALRAGLHQQTLRRYRSGEVRTADTTRKIELAFGWPRGYIDARAEGREPPPIVHEPLPTPESAAKPEPVDRAELARKMDAAIAELNELSRQLRQTDEAG